MSTARKQAGATLLELIIVVGLLAFATVLEFESKRIEMEQLQARSAGGSLFEYNNAVRAFLTENSTATSSTHVGSGWLKATACGGSSATGYLPCNYPDATDASPIHFGILSLRTSIEVTGTGDSRRATATTTTSPYLNPERQPKADLAGLAAIVASAGSTQNSTPVLMSTDGRYKSDPVTAAITMIASNNATNDIWLRTDGSNTMKNNITFKSDNPAELRGIKNVARIQNNPLAALYLGTSGGALSASQVIVDADEKVLGALEISNDRGLAEALTVKKGDVRLASGSLSASGNVAAGAAVTAGTSVYANTTVSAGSSVSAGTDVTANRNVSANANVSAGADINAGGRITAQSDVTAKGALRGQIFYDENDNSYYVDPSQTSVLNQLETKGRSTFGEYILINGIATKGTSCEKNGLLSRDTSGQSLSCVNGQWSSDSKTGEVTYSTFTMGYDGTRNLGEQTFCAIGHYRSDSEDDGECTVSKNGSNWTITTLQQSYVGCSAICLNLNK